MVRRWLLGLALVLGVFLLPRHALAVPCAQTLVFVTGEVLTASVLNANPANEVTCINNIDNTNIGANGIYASQLIPTTAGQATFGGSIGYTFNPNNTGAIPLTITNAASPAVDYLDVVNSASTKLLFIDSTGNSHFSTTIIAAGSNGGGDYLHAASYCPSTGSTSFDVSNSSFSINGVMPSAWGMYCNAQKLSMDVNGNFSVSGTVAGTGHNACSATSGLPCAIQNTCTLSGGSCSMTATVPSNGICSSSPLFESGFTPQYVENTLASTTLTITVSYSGGTGGGTNTVCD